MAVQCTITQLLISNVLHGDPHGGNLLMTSDERLAYLDFGVLCRVDPKHARALLAFSVHAINGDFEELARDLADMEVVDASKHSIEAVANDFKQELPVLRTGNATGPVRTVRAGGSKASAHARPWGGSTRSKLRTPCSGCRRRVQYHGALLGMRASCFGIARTGL